MSCSVKNSHFCMRRQKILSFKVWNTCLNCSKCFLCFSFTNMSSKWATTNFLMKGLRIWVISLIMALLGALHNPEGITFHSHNSSIVLSVVFHSSPYLILIWWYPPFKSSFENTCEPSNLSSISFSLGIKNKYLTVILLITLLSTHIFFQMPYLFYDKQGWHCPWVKTYHN